MIHKSEINYYSLSELATELGNLRYDALAHFLDLLSVKIAQDGEKDERRGRIKLATHLKNCAEKLQECSTEIDSAWMICKTFMKD